MFGLVSFVTEHLSLFRELRDNGFLKNCNFDRIMARRRLLGVILEFKHIERGLINGNQRFYTLVTAIKSRPRYLTLRDYAFRHGLYSKAEQIEGKIYS